VVWWDPRALTLGLKPAFGVRREDLIVKDVPRNVVADGRGEYDRWQLARHDARAAGAVASLNIATVRQWSESESAAPESDVAVLRISNVALDERPSGTAFGLLVHEIVAKAPFGATRSTLDGVAAVEARVLGLPDSDASEAAAVVERMLAHDLLVRARAAEMRGACRRETPVTCVMPDGTLIEGVVDLAFEEQGVWTIVDYKTDRELEALGEARYRRQVALYASAVSQATGQVARGVLLRV
jgi:ATP-dependent exoDNAse (exonuclease V) beta subunit